jgi:hypothetical protein
MPSKVLPYARSMLTVTGGPITLSTANSPFTSGAASLVTPLNVQMVSSVSSVNVLSATAGTVIIWAKPTWGTDGTEHDFMSWQSDATHRIRAYKSSANNWALESYNGTADTATVATTHSANAALVLGFAWDASNVYASGNSASFTSAARSHGTPTIANTVKAYLGSDATPANYANAWIGGMLFFNVKLTDAQYAAYAAFTRLPAIGETLGKSMTALWAATKPYIYVSRQTGAVA